MRSTPAPSLQHMRSVWHMWRAIPPMAAQLQLHRLQRCTKATGRYACFATTAAQVELPAEADCVVVGGGSLGAACAYHLQQRGLRTVLLEKHQLTRSDSHDAYSLSK